MKEELLRILNIKLKYLTDNIDALNRMNDNLERENKGLEYIRSILSLFETSDEQYSVYNFSKLGQEDFEKIMVEMNRDVQAKFETENCNYEGLIYLINGINNGISLKLTDEQIAAIEFMIEAIVNRQFDYLARIDGVLLAKNNLEISDLSELTTIKEKYDCIIEKLETNDYVDETEEILDAITYSRVSDDKVIEILSYLLQYNSEIYHQRKETLPLDKQKSNELLEEKENEIDLSKPFVVSDDKMFEIPIFEEQNGDFNNLVANVNDEQIKNDSEMSEDKESFENDDTELAVPVEEFVLPEVDNNSEFVDVELPEVSLEEDIEPMVDDDFKDLVDVDDYYDEYNLSEENQVDLTDENNIEEPDSLVKDEEQNDLETGSNEIKTENLDEDAIKNLFNKYRLKYNDLDAEDKNLLLKGNVEKYSEIIEFLRDKELLNAFEKNKMLLVQTFVNSDLAVIEKVLTIIENYLSVDKDDKKITTDIMIAALPTVFVKEPFGNYETFVKNVNLFKEWEIDLINLFDFSREIYVMNHDKMVENAKIVKTYNLNIDDKNAKYLLVLPDIAEKIDYYVEAVATDNMKNGTGKTFDGNEYIKLYPNKLNSVTDTTIKRLRYSSENGKKIFGAKEKSLAGEITNLKVDVLNIGDEYLRTYFNNEFDMISHDEVLEYERLIKGSNDYSLSMDETLENLSQYENGLRYNIDGINISRNKLIRNYNILIKNGVDKTNALIFAACYNAVITKEEYQKVKNTLSNIGGR